MSCDAVIASTVLVFLALPAAADDGAAAVAPSAVADDGDAAVTPSAVAAPSAERPRLLVMGATGADVEPSILTTTTEILTVELARRSDLEVLSGNDIKRMVELEAERVSVGCDMDASCLADIAGALGARYVVSPSVGRLGGLIIVTLSLFDAREGKAVAREVIEAESPEVLPSRLRAGAQNLLASFEGAPRQELRQAAPPASSPKAAPPAATEGGPMADLTLRDVVVIAGKVLITAGLGVIALGVLGFCGGYAGVIIGTMVASDKPGTDTVWASIPVAGPIINIGRRAEEYDLLTVVALVSSVLFQTGGLMLFVTGGVCFASGAFLVGFDAAVPGAPADTGASSPGRGGSVDDAVAMAF